MSERRDLALVAVTLGAIAGMRSMSAPAVVATHLGSPLVRWVTRASAVGEMVMDKTGLVPDRIDPLPLAGRIVIGGASAAFVARTAGKFVAESALIGAAAAACSAYAFYRLRRAINENSRIPDEAVGLCEDALVVAAGAQLTSNPLLAPEPRVRATGNLDWSRTRRSIRHLVGA